jgi:tetratricopeptide (TPR) repeat protein
LSDGEHLRVSTQLVQAPEGTLLWSTSSQVSLQDIFQLQDDLADRIVKALALPLTSREQRALKHDVPANAMAYELYLRANQLVAVGYDARNMILARDLYLRSVEADPKYAPAWACLGRTYRLIGKYGVEDLPTNLARAEDAFQKSLGLNPDLALAHNFYTSLETDMGHSLRAMERLLKRAGEHPNDPHLFAGLVHACRYCGQLKASVAAHELARRLDPNIRTTVVYTHLNRGDFQAVLDQRGPGDEFAELQALIALGRKPEAMAYFLEFEKTNPMAQLLLYAASRRAFIEGDRTKSLDALDALLELDGPLTRDPESHFWMARDLASLNQPDRALSLLSLTLESGYRCHYALLHDHCFDSVRLHRGFTELVARAEALDLEARTVFLENGGQDLLGVRAG